MAKGNKKIQKAKKKKKKNNIPFFLLPAFIFVFSFIGLIFFFYNNFQGIFFPDLHKNQESPLIVYQKKKHINSGQIPQIIENGPRDQKKIALTFDADMTFAMQKLLKLKIVKSWYNKSIKDTLDKENVKATIFLTGLWAETYPNEAKELAKDPLFEIGNHSYSHPAFTKNCFRLPIIDDNKDENEVMSAQNAIKKATGITPKYFRFPGGCYDKIDLNTITKLNLEVIHWDIASGDGFNNNADSIVQKVESKVQNGSIIVFHLQGGSLAPKTNEALVKIIPFLKKEGYQLVTISELLNSANP